MYLFKHVSSINFTCTHDFYNPTKRGHTLSPDKESIDLNFQENIITYKEEQPSEEAKTSEEASAETKIKIISRLGKWDPESSTSDSKLLQLRKLNEVHLEKILKEQDESIYNQSEEIRVGSYDYNDTYCIAIHPKYLTNVDQLLSIFEFADYIITFTLEESDNMYSLGDMQKDLRSKKVNSGKSIVTVSQQDFEVLVEYQRGVIEAAKENNDIDDEDEDSDETIVDLQEDLKEMSDQDVIDFIQSNNKTMLKKSELEESNDLLNSFDNKI